MTQLKDRRHNGGLRVRTAVSAAGGVTVEEVDLGLKAITLHLKSVCGDAGRGPVCLL